MSEQMIWGGLLHLGCNGWSDTPVKKSPPPSKETEGPIFGWRNYRMPPDEFEKYGNPGSAADYLLTDDKLWRDAVDYLGAGAANMVLVDLFDGVVYPSHPELAIKGSWSVEKIRAELARIRKLGLEPIPKLNFSATHDFWLKEYSRLVSTPAYYKVCADVIRDAWEIFDHPRFFHLGFDEETYNHQSGYSHVVVRHGDLWWHDFLYMVHEVETLGSRAWIWSDKCWHARDEFLNRMPKSVLQSNWYYCEDDKMSDEACFDPKRVNYVQTFLDLDKAGFDQIPCGSNWARKSNFGNLVKFCSANLDKSRLKGFLMASWAMLVPYGKYMDFNFEAIDILKRARESLG